MASIAISELNELTLGRGVTANTATKPNAKGDLNGPLCQTVNYCFFLFLFFVGVFFTIFLPQWEKRVRERGWHPLQRSLPAHRAERKSKTHTEQR